MLSLTYQLFAGMPSWTKAQFSERLTSLHALLTSPVDKHLPNLLQVIGSKFSRLVLPQRRRFGRRRRTGDVPEALKPVVVAWVRTHHAVLTRLLAPVRDHAVFRRSKYALSSLDQVLAAGAAEPE